MCEVEFIEFSSMYTWDFISIKIGQDKMLRLLEYFVIQTPDRGSPPGPRWGTPIPALAPLQEPLTTLAPNSGSLEPPLLVVTDKFAIILSFATRQHYVMDDAAIARIASLTSQIVHVYPRPKRTTAVLVLHTGWLKLKYPTGQNAISRQPCAIFIPKFLDFSLYGSDPATILNLKKLF